MQKKTRTRIWSILLSMTMLLSLLPVTALANNDGLPTASGTNFFANGTAISITAGRPEGVEALNFGSGFTAAGTDAYISWQDGTTTKYVGVSSNVSVFGGGDGRTASVTISNTNITMTGGTVWNVFGGNYGEEGRDTDFCSTVTGNVNISLSGTAVVKNLLHGAGARNTCVNGTITMEFDGVDLSDSSSQLYVNGGSWGNGNEGTRNIADGTMDTEAVANKVVIKAENSKFYLLGGGGSGSTKVRSSSVTLNNCTLSSLYLGGINGEVEESSIVATGCTIEDFSATNRGFVGTARVELKDCDITEKLNFGAANGCFSSDSGTPDGSGITGSSEWKIDAETTVAAAALTPLAMRGENDVVTATFDNLTIEKEGEPLPVSVNTFNPGNSVTVNDFLVPETSALTLKNVQATVAADQTLTNVGTIDMDAASTLTVDTGATFGQLGTVNGGNVVTNDGGTFNNNYVARIGTTGYATLQEAVDAVTTTENTTITLLKDTAGAGVVVNGTVKRNLTFDLGGHTYTITSGVGSSGTETNGFQLIKDNNITFKNGTIAADPAEGEQVKILIQNYSNLTLENVTLDGTGMTDYTGLNYTLSNNNGAINLNTGTTIIPRADDEIAMDVCWAASYENGARVTVNEGATIQGNVELGLWGKTAYDNRSVLTVNGGTITGELKLDQTISSDQVEATIESLKTNITINGGSFGASVDAYVDSTDQANAKVQSGDTHSYYTSMEDALAAAKPGDTITDLKTAVDDTATLTLNYNDGGITTDSVYTVAKNTEVPLPTPTRSGYYTFLNWSDGTKTYAGGTKYTVLADATLTAQWSYNPPYTGGSSSSGDYAVSVESGKNGTVTVSPSRADKGDTVTITVKPVDGYELDTLTVTDKNGDTVKVTYKSENKYTFTMPGSKVTIEATFAEISEDLPFTDVAAGAWYADAVQFVYENGLMAGITATTFGPNVTTSRAMLATILYRLEGEPNVTAASFTDVESGMYYTDAVAWASSKGIVTGYGDGTFLPNKAISREEMAAMLYRYASYKGYDVTGIKDLGGYSDAGSVSSYAVEALQWATGAGLVTDMGDGTLSPTGLASRAQIATILMRFLGE